MSYAVKQDMIDRFAERELIQLTDRTAGEGVAINDTVLGRALADTDAEIDGYLMGRYTLPLNNVPKMLVSVACDIARYRLYDDRVTEQVQKRYDDAVKLLRMIGEGKISIGPNSAQDPTPSTAGAQSHGDDRVFDRSTLSDY